VSVLQPTPLKGSKADVHAGATHVLNVYGTKPAPTFVPSLDMARLVGVDASGTKLLIHEVGSSALKGYPIPSLEPGVSATLDSLPSPHLALLRTSTGGSLLVLLPSAAGAGGAPKLLRAIDGPAGSHVVAQTSSKEKSIVALAQLTELASGAQLRFEALPLETDGSAGEWSEAETLPYSYDVYGGLADGWLNSYMRKDGSLGHRLLVSSSDHSLQLLQAGKDGARAGWVRLEALASVEHSEPVPLPALISETTGGAEDSRPSFGFALPTLLESIQSRLAEASAGPTAAAGAKAAAAPAHADAYGFRQAMVVTTSAGKLFGLHTSDGSVLWQRRVPRVSTSDEPPKLPFLFILRGGGAPQAVVVAQGESSWALHSFSPTSGKLLSEGQPALSGEGKIVHAVRLTAFAADDGSTRPPLMLVDDSLRVFLYPDTADHRAQLQAKLGDLFFYLHRKDAGFLTGYAVAAAEPSDSSTAFKAVKRWSIALPKQVEAGAITPTVTLASFPADAIVASPVRVLGDRNVLHKYINRNLLAVGVEKPGDGEFEEPSLLIMLVDTVSGRVVHSVTHPGMRGPLTMLLGENWLVWHFWNVRQLAYQMGVVELFTNSTVSDDPLSLLLGGAPDYMLRENGFDGFSHPPPHTLAQGYAFGAPVEALAVTQTVAGLTPKSVLVATTAGQLVLLDKRFLDPRRPLLSNPQKMSTTDREEGLVPYGPSLGGISPLTVATHRYTVARPKAITSSATNLESTSLAFLTGLDLFMTRVAPAREFDRLNEDFNFVALVGAILFLAVATVATNVLSDKKDLKRAWK